MLVEGMLKAVMQPHGRSHDRYHLALRLPSRALPAAAAACRWLSNTKQRRGASFQAAPCLLEQLYICTSSSTSREPQLWCLQYMHRINKSCVSPDRSSSRNAASFDDTTVLLLSVCIHTFPQFESDTQFGIDGMPAGANPCTFEFALLDHIHTTILGGTNIV